MTNKDFDQHFNTDHRIKCHICPALFEAVLDFKKHLDTEHKTIHEKFKECSQCEYKTTQKCHLKAHVKTVHDGIIKIKEYNKPNQCPNCPARFEYRGELNNHLNLVHGGKVFNAQDVINN
jgi:uncharacterized Zn-finger protein